jgi:hypothetical protein
MNILKSDLLSFPRSQAYCPPQEFGNALVCAILLLLLLTGPVLRADPPIVAPTPAADPLAEALPMLQMKYVDFKALNSKQGDHLSDLIARSNGGISLVTPETASAPIPIVTATLPGGVIYWRLASFTPEKSWLDLGTQLKQESGNAAGIILDLRSNIAPDDYHGAAQILGFFAPEDLALSKYDAVGIDHGATIPDHSFHSPIIVLTNNQTTGAAEALAAFLKADGALVVGRATQGKAAIFKEQKLFSGQVLRFAVENIAMADGTPLWNHPVTPDIAMTVDDHAEKAALALIKDNQILDVIEESPERHRLSEASLVQGQDPEWDDYLASLERKPVLLSLPVIHDVVLVSALDSLKAIRLSERSVPPESRADASPQSSASLQ